MIGINLYVCTDENNRLNKTSLSGNIAMSGTFRSDVSVMTPVFQMETSTNIAAYNYAYIPDFGRYYFITDIKAVRNNLWELSLTCDVLMTYRTALLDVPVIASRSEKNFNQMLKDGERLTYQDTRIQTYNFPRSLDANGRKYYLVLAGGNETILEQSGVANNGND